MRILSSLKSRAILWVITAMIMGMASASLWMYSLAQWNQHLHTSYVAGLGLFETLRDSAPANDGIEIVGLSGPMAKLAGAGLFRKLPDVLASDFITQLSLSVPPTTTGFGSQISLAVISPDLKYPLADLGSLTQNSTGGKLADLTRLLATYCSDPILFVQYEAGPWLRIDGTKIWGCDAAPADLRLGAIFLAALSMAVLVSVIISTSASFQSFADALSKRGLLGGGNHYNAAGPDELRAMITAINAYLDVEQESLARRATFLSGVSHDLGTPATRLRLRIESIADSELREKLNGDIDQMTSMIESVLSYTQSEMKLEEPRQLSLVSLVEAIVADFQDADQPVQFIEQDAPTISARTILFNSTPRSLNPKLVQQHGVVIQARPLSLQRAITNLIDNALKYGRKANVSVQADSKTASIMVDDYGDGVSVEDLRELTTPFRRGHNAANVKGFGIGLAITSTIAEQHGGSITFQHWDQGVRAILSIPR